MMLSSAVKLASESGDRSSVALVPKKKKKKVKKKKQHSSPKSPKPKESSDVI